MAAVHCREDIYPRGRYAERAPDLLVEFAASHQGGPAVSGEPFTAVPRDELAHYSGTHDMTGIFLARGAGVRAGHRITDMTLLDLAPTVLWAAAQPIPEAMEGTVRRDLDAEGNGRRALATRRRRDQRQRREQARPGAPSRHSGPLSHRAVFCRA